MAIQKTEAFVLKTQPFRSTSLILTFFTRSFGKLKGMVKGARIQGEVRPAQFELFSRLEIIFYEKIHSDLHLVSESSVLETNESLRSSLDSIVHASYFSELIDQLTEVHDPNEKIFELLDFCLRYLPSLPAKRLARLFEIKFLNEIGWLPHLEDCLQCHQPLEKGFFSPRQGALVCDKCVPNFPDAKPVGREALSVMRYYIKHDLEESIKWKVSRQAESETESLMGRFLMDRLNKPLKTRQFLEKVQPVLHIA